MTRHKMYKHSHMISLRSLRLLAAAMSVTAGMSTASAQVGDARNDFSVGVTAGYTMTKMDFMPRIKQKNMGAPMFGFAARYVCEKYFTTVCGVVAEVQMAKLGWEEIIEDGTGNTYKRDLNYVQVPILMQMGWGRERKGFKFLFEAGPQLGYYISGKEHKGGGEWNTSLRPNHVTHQYGREPDNKFDYGITAGLGLEFSSPIGHFLLQGRYYYGLGDIYDNSKRGYFSRSAHQTIGVKMTYLFDIVKTKNDGIK